MRKGLKRGNSLEAGLKEAMMDARMKVLVAMGASAAVNCRPCMEHHLAKCDALGVPREEIAAAVEVGMMVSRGAAAKTRSVVDELLGTAAQAEDEKTAATGG
jgi:AhpD family alkylhydroperoxidase